MRMDIFRPQLNCKECRLMTHNQAFGKALREQRTLQGLSQDSLAFAAGLDRTYISLLELGTKSPTLDTIFLLCRALKISLSVVAHRTEEILEASHG